MMVKQLPARRLDLDVDACRQTQLVQSLDRLGRGLHDVDQPLVRANLKLLPGLFVDRRSRKYGVSLNPCWKWNGTMHFRVGPLRGIHNLLSALVENRMVVSL